MAEARPPLGWKQNSSLPHWLKCIFVIICAGNFRTVGGLTKDRQGFTIKHSFNLYYYYLLNAKTFFTFLGSKESFFFFSKKQKSALQNTRRPYQRVALEEQSDLCCNRLHVTAIKQARRQEQRRVSLRRAGCVGETNGSSQKNCMCHRHQRGQCVVRPLIFHRAQRAAWRCWEVRLFRWWPRSQSSCVIGASVRGPAGMRQSAEPTEDSFHDSGSLLLTSHLAAHAARRITCQPLTAWRSRVTPAWLPSSLKTVLGMRDM